MNNIPSMLYEEEESDVFYKELYLSISIFMQLDHLLYNYNSY